MRNPFAKEAGAAGELNFSRTAESDRDFAGFENDRDLAPPIGKLQHALKPRLVLQYVDVLVGNLAARESLPGSGRVGSKVFPENNDFFFHDRGGHAAALLQK